jgi:hypothetical protein
LILDEKQNSQHKGETMKKLGLFLFFLITFGWGCGYGMHYTKSIHPVPQAVSAIRVMDIEDAKVKTRYGEEGSGKTGFIKNILVNELLQTGKFTITDNAEHALYVKIDGYRAGYRKYIALSAKIVKTETNETVWGSSISGLSKSYIDEVITNTVKELVVEMTKYAGKSKEELKYSEPPQKEQELKALEPPETDYQREITYDDGSKYIGDTLNGKRHGQGTYIWPDGRKYVGEWRDNRATGGWFYKTSGKRVWVYQDSDGKWIVKQ